MLPCTLLLLFARNALVEYRRGRLGKPFASLGDDTISAVVQTAPVDDDILDGDLSSKVPLSKDPRRTLVDDSVSSRIRRSPFWALFKGFRTRFLRYKAMSTGPPQPWNASKSNEEQSDGLCIFVFSLFNYTVPWLSVLLIVILGLVSIILYYIPLRYLILAFVINKFTKRFRKPKGYIDNNEIADFMSRLPSDPELVSSRALDPISSHHPFLDAIS